MTDDMKYAAFNFFQNFFDVNHMVKNFEKESIVSSLKDKNFQECRYKLNKGVYPISIFLHYAIKSKVFRSWLTEFYFDRDKSGKVSLIYLNFCVKDESKDSYENIILNISNFEKYDSISNNCKTIKKIFLYEYNNHIEKILFYLFCGLIDLFLIGKDEDIEKIFLHFVHDVKREKMSLHNRLNYFKFLIADKAINFKFEKKNICDNVVRL